MPSSESEPPTPLAATPRESGGGFTEPETGRGTGWGGGPPRPGQLLFGKYLVIRQLGQGGMGSVWLVRHRELDVDRALKLIVSNVAFNQEMRARFRREARAMARFSHPNIVAVHDADVRPDSEAAFIEMDYVEGQSLDVVLKKQGAMQLDWVAQLVEQICDALQVAHEHGIVHRDLKPTNLMLAAGQPPGKLRLKVLDFGIAKILSGDGPDIDETLTQPGSVLGTPQYMSPEQIDVGVRTPDARSDLYSVGLILYECVTGQRPFTGPAYRLAYDHLHTPAPALALKKPDIRVPIGVERLILRCLEKDPARRPQSARELAEEFDRIVRPRPQPPPPPSRRLVLGAVAAVLPVIGILAWALWPRRESFSVRPITGALELRAGENRTLSFEIKRPRARSPVALSAIETPPGLELTADPSPANDELREFRLEVDLNARPGQRKLAFRATTPREPPATATVDIVIVEPAFYCPSGYERAEGARLQRASDKAICPERIVRRFPDGTHVDFLLIPKSRPSDPDSFYIMQNKVWNSLYAKFADSHPNLPKRDVRDRDGDLPATDVTAREASDFAQWIGGLLPSREQWDKAAGRHDRKGSGPFLEPWNTNDPKPEVAVDRPSPLPVGTATHDVSPFGCRDMAGNGLEWTRNFTSGDTLPAPKDALASLTVVLRGQSYQKSEPLRYEALDIKNQVAFSWLKGDPEIGFRVVIEIEP